MARLKVGKNDLEFRVDKQGMEVPLLSSDYQAYMDIHGSDMTDTVNAFEEALAQIYARLLSDIDGKLGQ